MALDGVMTTSKTPGHPGNRTDQETTEAVFSMKGAAQAAGISVSTLRRNREALRKYGAKIDSAGWEVPYSALLAAGLIATEGAGREDAQKAPLRAVEPVGEPVQAQRDTEALEDAQQAVDELREEVARWRERAKVAEALLEERGRSITDLRGAIEVERLALRQLMPATAAGETAGEAATETVSKTVDQQKKRGWWFGGRR